MNKVLMTAAFISVFGVTGCASYQHSAVGFDASKVDAVLRVNKATLADVRAIMGTPTVVGVVKADGSKFVGYSLVGQNSGATFLRNMGKDFITFGLGSRMYAYTLKNVYFKVNSANVVVQIKKNGYAYVSRFRLTHWNECETKLTSAEVNSSTNYEDSEVCARYAKGVAAAEGIAEDEVDIGKEYKFCNIPCHAVKGAIEAFGALASFADAVDAEPNDGARADELYGREHLSSYAEKEKER